MSARIEGERLADSSLEWLETDGFGGFASGTVGLERTRRYHGLLLAATRPPTGRTMLVNGLEAWIETASGRQALSTHRYRGDVLHPDGRSRLTAFESEPWPSWINGFVDEGGAPAYNSADASLWYVVAVHDYLTGCDRAGRRPAPRTRAALTAAVRAILDGYAAGTRYGISADEDGLLAAGEPGWQLTWMDARADGREITPRCGKPVELQALWVSALAAGRSLDLRLGDLERRARASFAARFWNEAAACLYDVVDVDHVRGTTDPAVRPNQILAVGGLPWPLLDGRRARSVVDVVERQLWTPLGLRSLAPDEADYVPHYVGGPSQRDAAYHQGTVWPWLAGPFVEAWIAVRGGTQAARKTARARFVAPLLAHLDEAGLGHVSEITDAEAPFVPRGAPFQAWSLGELLRLEHAVLVPRQEPAAHGAGASA